MWITEQDKTKKRLWKKYVIVWYRRNQDSEKKLKNKGKKSSIIDIECECWSLSVFRKHLKFLAFSDFLRKWTFEQGELFDGKDIF